MKQSLSRSFLLPVISLGVGILVGCLSPEIKRDVASLDLPTDNLIVAEKDLGDANGHKMLLIGISQHESFDHHFNLKIDVSHTFTSRVFPPQDLTAVDPRFLIIEAKEKIEAVYAFNMKKTKSFWGLEKDELPPVLLDSAHLIRQTLLPTPVKQVLNYVGYLPEKVFGWGPLFSLFDNTPGEQERNREASYLLQILDGAMFDQKYQALQHYFPPRYESEVQTLPNLTLCDLGSILSIRFHPSSNLAIVFSKSARRVGLYCNEAPRLRDQASLQEERLMKEWQDTNIRFDRIADTFIVASYDPNSLLPAKNFSPHGKQTQNIEKLNQTLNAWIDESEKAGRGLFPKDYTPGQYVPFAIISGSTNSQYVTILHFFEESRQRRESLMRNLYAFLEALKAPFTIINPILIPVDVADDYFTTRAKQWNQSTFFENTSMQYGRLMAFLQISDGLEFDWSKTADQGWLAVVNHSLKLGDKERSEYSAAVLNHDDNLRRNHAINDIVARSLIAQSGTKGSATGGANGPEKAIESRLDHWNHFLAFMQDSRSNDFFSHKIAEWDQANLKNQALAEKRQEKAIKKDEKREIKAALLYPDDPTFVAPVVCYANGILTSQCGPGAKEAGRPVILFAVDGLRPELLEYWARRKIDKFNPLTQKVEATDVIPNIKKYFLRQGVHFPSAFTEHSVSVSSFSTILTGFEADTHGVVVASSESRDPKSKPRDYLDYIADNHFFAFANEESQGLTRIHQAGLRWIPDYLAEEQKITVLAPVHDKKFIPYAETGHEILKQGVKLAYGITDDYTIIDKGQSDHLVNLIRKNKGQYRFVFNYYIGVDHAGHNRPSEVNRALASIDEGIGSVIHAALRDPLLKNAVILLISDHGLSGGKEFADPLRQYMTKNEIDVDNQMFNANAFFAGDFPDYPEYRFAVGASTECEARNVPTGTSPYGPTSLYNSVVAVRPLMFDTCRSERARNDSTGSRNRGRPGHGRHRTMFLSAQGDGRATALILDDPKHPAKRKSFYELSHYTNPEMVEAFKKASAQNLVKPNKEKWQPSRNIISDLIHYRSPQFQTPQIINDIKKLNGLHPIDVLTLAVQGFAERRALQKLAGISDSETGLRDPVIVQGVSPDGATTFTALIFIKDGSDLKSTYFRYVIVKGFDQVSPGPYFRGDAFTELSPEMTKFDPLHYKVLKHLEVNASNERDELVGLDPQVWYADRDLFTLLIENEIARNVREERVTAVPSIARIMTLNSHMEKSAPDYFRFEQGVIPDFAFFSSEAFHFDPTLHVADHGGLRRSEVGITLMVTDLKNATSGESDLHTDSKITALTRDIAPTVLDYLGVPPNDAQTQGESLRAILDH